jgi:hypothetical protein
MHHLLVIQREGSGAASEAVYSLKSQPFPLGTETYNKEIVCI